MVPTTETGEGGANAAFSYSGRGRPVFANVLDRFRALALSLLLIAAFALPALAGPFEDAVGKFANDEFSDTDEAIGAVVASGNPLAFAIISALQDGRLMADPDSKKVYVTQPDGKIIDAATAELPSPACPRGPPQFASTTACAAPSKPHWAD